MKILGIETSCDETAAAIVTDERVILSNVLRSQKHHEEYGGVVPEIAARAHLKLLQPLVDRALKEAGVARHELDGVAATGGPGLIGGVIVGTMFAKGMAAALDIPYIAVNHLAGHALTVRLTHDVAFPYLLLLSSGGHCQFLLVKGIDDYEALGTTIDDAAGEAFDKVGKMMGFSYPAGPIIEKQAALGDENKYTFPKPLIHGDEHYLNFSFSGLKTSVKRQIDMMGDLSDGDRQDIAACFQKTVADIFVIKSQRAVAYCQTQNIAITHFVLAGGVAANLYIRGKLEAMLAKKMISFIAPPVKLCTDNAAMIAWAGIEQLKAGQQDNLDFAPRPRWPLDRGEE